VTAIVRPESLGGDYGPPRTLATARQQLERKSPEAVAAGYQEIFTQSREDLLIRRDKRDPTVVEIPGTQRRRAIRDLSYAQIIEVARRRAERAVNRALMDYSIQGERRGKMRAGEAL